MHDPEIKNKAIALRKSGKSFKDISNELQISRPTIVRWVKHINITKSQQQINILSYNKKRKMECRNLRKQYQNIGKEKAKENNQLHLIGCILYWAEGFKSRNDCGLANTDPKMIQLFLKFLRECFGITNEQINMRINCYDNNGLTIDEIESYWLEITSLDKSCIRKAIVNQKPRSATGKPKNGKHPYGICTIRGGNTKVVQSIYGSLQIYANLPENFGLNFNLNH